MAVIKQTDFATGRKDAPTPYEAGCLACAVFPYTVATAITAATDIIALGYLPAGCIPVRAELYAGALGAGCTADVGFMSGPLGSNDTAQTSADELIDGGAAHNATAVATIPDLMDISVVDYHRPIGLKVSQDVAAANQKIWLLLWYRPGPA